MGKVAYKRLKGCRHLRQRLVLATLAGTPVVVEDIRSEESSPGLRSYEVSLLRLLESISDDCLVEINETGTKLRYKPGVLMGGKRHVHDCGLSRSIGYFIEPLIILGLFGKKPLTIRLKGITNDSKDPSVDTFRTTTLHMLKRFGVPIGDGLDLKIERRGAPPLGGGDVLLQIPIVPSNLSAAHWIDEGMVKRIRGIAFSTKVSPQTVNSMIYAARGIFNSFIPDVHIFSDVRTNATGGRTERYNLLVPASILRSSKTRRISPKCLNIPSQKFEKKKDASFVKQVPLINTNQSGSQPRKNGIASMNFASSPGYGISLVAETTTGCLISADMAVSDRKTDEMEEEMDEKPNLIPPEELGVQAASMLLEEIEQGGVVDSTHQGLLFILCALCPPDISKVRVGKLTPYGIETLRNIRDFLGVKFDIKPDPNSGTVLLKCLGSGMKNLSRKVS